MKKAVPSCLMVIALSSCGRPEQYEEEHATLASKPAQQEFLIQVTPNASCFLSGPDDPSKLILDADDGGFVHLWFGPASQVDHSPGVRLTCRSTTGAQTTMDVDMQAVLASQPTLRAAASELPSKRNQRPLLGPDPTAYTDAELVSMGYPPRPDPQKAPSAYARWLRQASRAITLTPPNTIEHPNIKRVTSTGTMNQWSGIFLNRSGSTVYWDTDAQWTVPTNTVLSLTGTAAIWVGLDGAPNSGTTDLCQGGTDSDTVLMGGNYYSSYYAWIEWVPGGFAVVPNFTVSANDGIFAEVWVGDNSRNHTTSGGFCWLYLENFTTFASTTVAVAKPSGVTFQGKAAEWILERGTTSGVVDNLAKYGSASITSAEVWDTGWGWHSYDTDTSTLIDMVNPANSHLLSDASAPGFQEIDFVWHASN